MVIGFIFTMNSLFNFQLGKYCTLPILLFIFLKDFVYLFDREWESTSTSRGRGRGRGRSSLFTKQGAGSPMLGSIPGPWDLDLRQRQMFNWLNHPSAPNLLFLKTRLIIQLQYYSFLNIILFFWFDFQLVSLFSHSFSRVYI